MDETLAGVLAPRIEAFRSAVAGTLEQLRATVSAAGSKGDDAGTRAQRQLGPFADERIDAVRLETLVGGRAPLDTFALATMRTAESVLQRLLERGETLFVVRVQKGQRLGAAVYRALADAGRAFGAARVADLARSGRYHDEVHASWLEAYPFREWSAAERQLAPPLLIDVAGEDLAGESLAEFMDGRVKLILRAQGASSPAPLARLITPRSFAMQARTSQGLERAIAFDGPAVVALAGDGAAEFVHDPAAGDAVWKRLTVGAVPPEGPKRTLGGRSAAQQTDELTLLLELAARPPAVTAAVGEVAPIAADPAGKLAAWLLSRT